MTIIVEDGSGLADADTYCSVEAADAYHAARGNGNAWNALAITRKWELLRLATEYMAGYAPRWQGARVGPEQALDWPRAGVEVHGFPFAPDALPKAVRDACAVLALRALAGPLLRDPTPVKTRVKLGPLETEYAQPPANAKPYPEVDRMLAPLLVKRNPYMIPLRRA